MWVFSESCTGAKSNGYGSKSKLFIFLFLLHRPLDGISASGAPGGTNAIHREITRMR